MKLQIKVGDDGVIQEAVFKVGFHNILATIRSAHENPLSWIMKRCVFERRTKLTITCVQTFGCGSAIASSSVATEWVKGMKVDDAVKIKNTEIANHLNLPPVKLHCSMLAEDAIKAAVKDFKAKQEAKASA